MARPTENIAGGALLVTTYGWLASEGFDKWAAIILALVLATVPRLVSAVVDRISTE